jgi:hypothetical protein
MAMFETATVLFIVGVIIMLPLLKVPAAQRE